METVIKIRDTSSVIMRTVYDSIVEDSLVKYIVADLLRQFPITKYYWTIHPKDYEKRQ